MIEFLGSFFFPEEIFWGGGVFFRKFAEHPLPVLLMGFSRFTRDFFEEFPGCSSEAQIFQGGKLRFGGIEERGLYSRRSPIFSSGRVTSLIRTP